MSDIASAKPLAITLGDPAGIGPEVAAKTLATATPGLPWLLVGPRWALERGAEVAGVTLPKIIDVQSPEELSRIADGGKEEGQSIALLDINVSEPDDFAYGQIQATCGRIAVQSVEYAARACLQGEVAAMVTCPLHKEAIHAAGYTDDIGHQEILTRLTLEHAPEDKSKDTYIPATATMLMTPGLRVAHLSTHKSLIEAAQYVQRDIVLAKLQLIHATLSRWGISQPRIAVAALNPHGGEGGLLGREEIEELTPAVQQACAEGILATGPIPADSVFNRAIDGEFDVVLALYHDQGHIAIKVHNFHESTTATLGIPFIRTSVDHGTAFDIAGKGIADPQGLQSAIATAEQILAGNLGHTP